MRIIPVKIPGIPVKEAYLPCLVDDEDYEKTKVYKWYGERGASNNTFYARTAYRVSIHRLIMDSPQGLEINHINGNGLDNRRQNLEICTKTKNGLWRVAVNKNNKSGCPGVSWHKQQRKWYVTVRMDGKNRYLGLYEKLENAIEARKQFSIKHNLPFLCRPSK